MKKKCMAVGGAAKKPATMEEQLAALRGKVRPGYQAGGIAGIDFDYPLALARQSQNRPPLGSGLGATAIQSGEAPVNAPGSTPQSLGLLDAQTKLISSAAQYYNARTDVQKLVTDAAKFNVSTTLDAAVKNQATDMQLIEDRLNALLTEIKAFAQIATSLFNNLHANAGTSYNVSVS